ncbi:MAG: hypothetical protein ABIA93_02000 [Candidatus Woesearchaeota archaeon]
MKQEQILDVYASLVLSAHRNNIKPNAPEIGEIRKKLKEAEQIQSHLKASGKYDEATLDRIQVKIDKIYEDLKKR